MVTGVIDELAEPLMKNTEGEKITLERGEIMDLESKRRTKNLEEFLGKAKNGTQFCYRSKDDIYVMGSIDLSSKVKYGMFYLDLPNTTIKYLNFCINLSL